MRTALFHTFLIIFTNSVEYILKLRRIEKFYFYSYLITFIRFLDTIFLWLYFFYLLQFLGKSLTFRITLLIFFFFYYIHYLDNFYSGGEIQGLSGQTAISVRLFLTDEKLKNMRSSNTENEKNTIGKKSKMRVGKEGEYE